MVIFLDEERAYLAWVTHHRDGYVLDWLRKPTRKRPMLHRATCASVRNVKGKKSHWTTGRRLKACSLDLEPLFVWAQSEFGSEPVLCDDCTPVNAMPQEPASSESRHDHLTRLSEEILRYVIDVTVIHLDRQDTSFCLSVGDVADYLEKSPAQITQSLLRLVEDGYLRVDASAEAGVGLPREQRLYATAQSMKQLPAFARVSNRKIEAELNRLVQDSK